MDEKLGARLPLELSFTDLAGRPVTLGKYFTGEPVILTLNYYSCPMFCPLTFRNLTETIRQVQGLTLSRDFRVITVSIDPDESLSLMQGKAQEIYDGFKDLSDPAQRWPLLMGQQAEIDRLVKTAGYRYQRLEKHNFAHPSVFIVLTPDGRIARYLYGIELRPRDLKLALIEASDGKIGGSAVMNRVLLYCFHYDPAGKKYALAAINVMKIAGAAVLALLAILVTVLWRAEKRSSRKGVSLVC